jgi:hypothetical protein
VKEREERGGEEGSGRTSKPPPARLKSVPPPLCFSIRDYSSIRPLVGLNSFLYSASKAAVHSISTSFLFVPLVPLVCAPPRSSVLCSPLFLCSLLWSTPSFAWIIRSERIYWICCWLAALLCHYWSLICCY